MARQSASIITMIIGHFTTAPLTEVTKDLQYLNAIVQHRVAALPQRPARPATQPATAAAPAVPGTATAPATTTTAKPRAPRVRNRAAGSGRGPGRPPGSKSARPPVPTGDGAPAMTLAEQASTAGNGAGPATGTTAGPTAMPLPPMDAAEDHDPAAEA